MQVIPLATGELHVPEVQSVTLHGSPTVGTLSLAVLGEAVQWDYDATPAEVEDLLEALDGIEPGDVIVTGDPGGPWTIEFTGQLGGQDIPLIAVASSTLDGAVTSHDTLTPGGTGQNEVQTVLLEHAFDGTFTLTFDGQTTAGIDHDASAAAVDSALSLVLRRVKAAIERSLFDHSFQSLL